MPAERSSLLTGAKRFALLFVAVSGSTAAIAALVALITSHSYGRSISLGFYGVGGFLVAAGFGVGSRNTARNPLPQHDGAGGWVSGVQELREAVGVAGLLISVGLLVLLLGLIIDPRVRTV